VRAVHKTWDAALCGYEPYSSDQLSSLFDFIFEGYNKRNSEYPYYFRPDHEYVLKVGDFNLKKGINGEVTIEFEIPSKADSKPFMKDISHDIFLGLMAEFEKVPLLMHGATKMTQIMIKWRLLIGR